MTETVEDVALRDLAGRIDRDWDAVEADPSAPVDADAVDRVMALLDRGAIRVAEPTASGEWRVNTWVKRAVLLAFRAWDVEVSTAGPFEYRDKVPLKRGFEEAGVRVVPPATVRYGAYVSPGVVLMPSYVNVGAWIGPRTMVDTWATVGSCAQVGADVHLAGGVGIGGVLEPPQAAPVIVEDGAFIGSRCVVVEGVHVGARAVLGAGVVLTGNTPVLDVTGSTVTEHRGEVPAGAIVVPGSRARAFPAGEYGLPCGLVIGYRTEATDDKVRLNALLREHGSSLQ